MRFVRQPLLVCFSDETLSYLRKAGNRGVKAVLFGALP
jgi:hypothetical protein